MGNSVVHTGNRVAHTLVLAVIQKKDTATDKILIIQNKDNENDLFNNRINSNNRINYLPD